jgi:hypothetical protein
MRLFLVTNAAIRFYGSLSRLTMALWFLLNHDQCFKGRDLCLSVNSSFWSFLLDFWVIEWILLVLTLTFKRDCWVVYVEFFCMRFVLMRFLVNFYLVERWGRSGVFGVTSIGRCGEGFDLERAFARFLRFSRVLLLVVLIVLLISVQMLFVCIIGFFIGFGDFFGLIVHWGFGLGFVGRF